MPNERKVSTWSQKKIEKLIQIYAKEECLWNPYNENYKSKVKRSKAIEKMCKEIEIEPQIILKKIHNLRNQFNSEYKKLERCLEETEMLGAKPCWTSKWVHFDSLMFLKDVIVRMPATPPTKRLMLEASNADGELAEYNDTVDHDDDYDDPKIEEEFQNLTSNLEITNAQNASATLKDCKRLANMPTSSLQLRKIPHDPSKTSPQGTTSSSAALIEIANMNSAVPSNVQHFDLSPQDQWSSFGTFVANELRNLNSDLSRRKLKRKIMQAMLEVAEDDEI